MQIYRHAVTPTCTTFKEFPQEKEIKFQYLNIATLHVHPRLLLLCILSAVMQIEQTPTAALVALNYQLIVFFSYPHSYFEYANLFCFNSSKRIVVAVVSIMLFCVCVCVVVFGFQIWIFFFHLFYYFATICIYRTTYARTALSSSFPFFAFVNCTD